MLTKAGAKLMDFGLAKPTISIASQSVGTFTPSTPTMNLASLTAASSPLTQKGSIVGTFQYMAPELLQGAEADARSDLFSFGCVLYEMITGCRAFEGKSQLSVFTAILEKDPEPITAGQPLAPPMLDRVVRACLAKDPADRLQSAHDIALDLRWIAEAAPNESAKSSAQFTKTWVAWAAALLLAFIAVAAFAGYRWAKSSENTLSLHAEILPPEKFALDTTGDAGGMPVLSPQGDRIAFVVELRSKAADGSGAEKTLIAEQNNFHYPGWSPDGKYVTYLWGDGEKMVSLWIRPANADANGDAKAVAIVQPPSQQSNLSYYRISPDGRWVAYISDESGEQEIYLTRFPEGKGKWKVSSNGGYLPGVASRWEGTLLHRGYRRFLRLPSDAEGNRDGSRHSPASIPYTPARARHLVRRVFRRQASAGEPHRGRSPSSTSVAHQLAGRVEKIIRLARRAKPKYMRCEGFSST
jgi:hypothetical protein